MRSGRRPGAAKVELIEFCGQVRVETLAAYLVADGFNEVWLPKSQVRTMRRVGLADDDFEFVIPYWLAKKKGIV